MGVAGPWEAHMYWLRERGEARLSVAGHGVV